MNASMTKHIDGLVQERRNSSANALELRLSCTNPSILSHLLCVSWNQWDDMLSTFISNWAIFHTEHNLSVNFEVTNSEIRSRLKIAISHRILSPVPQWMSNRWTRVSTRNDRKAQKQLARRSCKSFSRFFTLLLVTILVMSFLRNFFQANALHDLTDHWIGNGSGNW